MNVYIDIETKPYTSEECEKFLKPIPPFDIEACKREFATAREKTDKGTEFLMKKEAEYYAKAKASRDEFVAKAALKPETGSVLCIGFAYEDSDDVTVLSGSEAEILRNFWQLYSRVFTDNQSIIGWNILDFDLPFLIRRSWKHSINIPKQLFNSHGRLSDSTFCDLKKIYACGVYGEHHSLDTAAKHILGRGKSDQEVTGAEFWRFWEGTPEQQALARQYLTNDVLLVKGLAEFML